MAIRLPHLPSAESRHLTAFGSTCAFAVGMVPGLAAALYWHLVSVAMGRL